MRYRSEPPSVTCYSCGMVDACECEIGECPVCGAEMKMWPVVGAWECYYCGIVDQRVIARMKREYRIPDDIEFDTADQVYRYAEARWRS